MTIFFGMPGSSQYLAGPRRYNIRARHAVHLDDTSKVVEINESNALDKDVLTGSVEVSAGRGR